MAQPQYRTVELFLFDTCTHKCAYCHMAETGKVLDSTQLRPYQDKDFIDGVVGFFAKRTTTDLRWLLTLTGGEPLMMPNFERFVDGVKASGNKVALYTAMFVGDEHPALRYLLRSGAEVTDYLMVSFHPEAEPFEDRFFRRLVLLKNAGHNVFLRFVGHPDRLHRLDELADRCRSEGIAFYPTTLFSPHYPPAYTAEERDALTRHMASLSQLIQLNNGLDTRFTQCWAGSRLISVDMRTGNITPCISVQNPVLGNLYDDTFAPPSGAMSCPAAGISCACDVHFQQDIVIGAEDNDAFERMKHGFVQGGNVAVDLAKLRHSEAAPMIGQTATAGALALTKEDVKAAYERNRDFFASGYSEGNHPSFKVRQNS